MRLDNPSVALDNTAPELHLWLGLRAARRHVKLRRIVEEALKLYREHVERGDTEEAAIDGDEARGC